VTDAGEPPSRLVFECQARPFEPDERTQVEVRFEGVDDGTRVTVMHRGWDRFPPDHPVRHGHTGLAFTNLMGVWWAEQLVTPGLRERGRSPSQYSAEAASA
jgi:hypothetical protein